MIPLLVPRERLPKEGEARHGALRDYFCDKDANATRVREGWSLSLAWPDGYERHIDPRLDEGLSWWGGNVRANSMALATRREGRILRTLYDTWTLHSWSEWLARRVPGTLEGLTILHVDDHRDLGAPRLFVEEGAWLDPIAGGICDLHEPNSVRASIESGALGMGSFLTPFLHIARGADVRHLCQPPKATHTVDHRIRLCEVGDTLIDPGRKRPAVELEPASGVGSGRYRTTPHVDDWLEGLGEGPVLLHIDMDYFNNRYDGDSDWQDRSAVLDPSAQYVAFKIDEMVDALIRHDLPRRLEDVVIAFSPGFFPAELWAKADTRLVAGLGLDRGR